MEPMTDAQRRTLNAACGDLAAAISWHGHHFDKNDFRHFFAGIVRGNRLVPAWDYGDGKPRGFVYMGGSSRELTKEEASEWGSTQTPSGGDRRYAGRD